MGCPFNTLMMERLNRRTHVRLCTNVTRAAVGDEQQWGWNSARMPSRNGGEIGEEIDRLLTNHHLQLQFQQQRTVLTNWSTIPTSTAEDSLSCKCTSYRERGVLTRGAASSQFSQERQHSALSTKLQRDSHPGETAICTPY